MELLLKEPRKSRISFASIVLVGTILFGIVLFTFFIPPLSSHDATFSRRRRELEQDDDICGHVKLAVTRKPGTLKSPNFPDVYPSDSNCSWLLIAPTSNDKIRIFISEIAIEPSIDCGTDYVAVYDGPTRKSKLMGRFCGREDDVNLLSSADELLVVFISDRSYEEEGFKLDYSLGMEDNCNITIILNDNHEEGIIVSPNYPNYYPDEMDCWTHLQAEDNAHILYSFDVLDLERAGECEFDYVEIYNGDERSGDEHVDRYCQQAPPLPEISKSDHLLIHFHSDNLLTSKGFVLSYSIIEGFYPEKNSDVGECTWNMGPSRLNGTITSPNYPRPYDNDQYCTFILEAPKGQRLRLTFDDVQLAADPDCHFDFVEVYDGYSINADRLGRYCDDAARGLTILSTSNSLYVRFVSDNEVAFTGFTARYNVAVGTNIIDGDDDDDTSDMMKGRVDQVDECDDCDVPQHVNVTVRPQNVSLAKGETHLLPCSSANKNDIIVWFKDLVLLHAGEESLPGVVKLPNGTVVIKNMNWKMQGIYTCVILSSGGMESSSAAVTLKKPSDEKGRCDIQFDLIPTNTALLEKNFVFLRCSAVNGIVTWFRNNVPLTAANHPRIRVILPGLLLINNAKSEDTGSFKCVAAHVTNNCTVTKEFSVFVSKRPALSCGHPYTQPYQQKNRIVGGTIAERGSLPWQAMLWETEADSFCGGTLVDSEWVVTAAHCHELFETNYRRKLLYKNLFIKLGKKDREKAEEGELALPIDKIIIHPEYHHKTFDNDIALIRLKRPVTYSGFIQPICLADPRFLNSHVYERNVLGTVSGWGLLAEKGKRPKNLREIRLPTVDKVTCQASTSQAITKNMFCAGYSQQTSRDACQGDSGGPFAVKIGSTWYLAGIVSWGEGCGAEGKYGVYTKVGNYYEWMTNTIQIHQSSSFA